MADDMQELGNTILELLLAYPWLIPVYLVVLWYLVIKPLTYTRREREEEAQQAQERTQHVRIERKALDNAGPEIRELLSRTYSAWRTDAAKFDWPLSLAQFTEHAARYRNADEYIEDRISESAGVVSTCAATQELTDELFADSEFIIRCEPHAWLLTNERLYVLFGGGDEIACKAFHIEDITDYRAGPFRITTADGAIFELKFKDFGRAPFKEEIHATQEFSKERSAGQVKCQ